ncbi:DUF4998 domain-containing protein [Fulvivirgaceae bacterium BMA12]|uniref:DUF4998 domain-containing protein n=1 Tax=Agaribacillus aureus TaxID=3051825 RepID=A0ABT8L0S7_9BACT|nr:DUF4998 domain-containing protein [Fulvivirgaceae bacterium BMA12]
MKYYKFYLQLYIMILGIATIISCDDSEDTFKQFLDAENASPIGAPKGVTSQAGTERVVFKLAITSDPRIRKGTVLWGESDGNKTFEFDVNRDVSGLDTLTISLNEVEEGIKRFVFTLFDDNGNASGQLSHTRTIYGSEYESGLLARRINSVSAFPSANPAVDSAVIEWSTPLPEVLETTFTYTDQNDVEQTIVINLDETRTILLGYNRSIPYRYKTRYLPESDALDTYVSAESSGEIPKAEVDLDKSLFQFVGLPTDLPIFDPIWPPGIDNPWTNVWDGDPNSITAFLGASNSRPAHITIDLGVTLQLSQLEVVGFLPFPSITPKEYQIWGIADLSGAETTLIAKDDLEAWQQESVNKGWTLLLDDNRLNVDDQTGFSQRIENETEVRYIRFLIIETFNPGNADTGINEISLKGFK